MDCINEVANVVYAESRGEGEKGMNAVVHIILNRSKKQGVKPCIIVKQRNQFTKGISRPKDPLWQKARQMVISPGKDFTYGATYFHNHTVRPSWSYKFKITLKLGNHIFYKP